MKGILLWYSSIQLNHSVLEDWIDVVENHSSQVFLITFCCWKCYGKWRKLLWLGHTMLACKSLSILFSPSTQKIKMSEQIYWRFSSLLVTLDSKSVTGWRLVLPCEEEQLSLATPPCLISGTGDLLIDHCWEIQTSSAGMQQKRSQQRKNGTAAVGPWQLKSNCLPSKQLLWQQCHKIYVCLNGYKIQRHSWYIRHVLIMFYRGIKLHLKCL